MNIMEVMKLYVTNESKSATKGVLSDLLDLINHIKKDYLKK